MAYECCWCGETLENHADVMDHECDEKPGFSRARRGG